jgi:Arc/MetJ-type ribon-helix-helix transcriptional regulator
MALKRAGRLKRLPDKSEVIRAALQLIEEDPELQQRVLGRL